MHLKYILGVFGLIYHRIKYSLSCFERFENYLKSKTEDYNFYLQLELVIQICIILVISFICLHHFFNTLY